MNTLTTVSYMTQATDNVILLSELEYGIPRWQLDRITELHNQGVRYEEISEKVKRNKYEVLIALIHQAKNGKRLRPLAYRRGNHVLRGRNTKTVTTNSIT